MSNKSCATTAPSDERSYVRAWDLPTRIAHWSIAVGVLILWWTGSYEKWQLHVATGEVLLGVVAFRIVWGFIGGSTARFAQMLKSPTRVIPYMRTLFSGQETWTEVGHNPLGSWSAAALLLALTISSVSGLFSETLGGLVAGPLSWAFGDDIALEATGVHQVGFELLLALLAVHVFAIAFYVCIKRKDLLAAMIHGQRLLPLGSVPMQSARLWAYVFALFVALGIVVVVVVVSVTESFRPEILHG